MLSIQSATAGGVAFWAHVGGFVVGCFMAVVLERRHATFEIVR